MTLLTDAELRKAYDSFVYCWSISERKTVARAQLRKVIGEITVLFKASGEGYQEFGYAVQTWLEKAKKEVKG